jgi:hypothetical protein
MNSTIVYTCILKGFDILRSHPEGKFIAFTDSQTNEWEIREPYKLFKDDRRNSRIQKIMPHLFLDCDYSIYLDGNIQLLVPPEKIIAEFLKDKDVAAFRHITRDCLYDEACACANLGFEDLDIIKEQTDEYLKRGYPRHNGLYEGGVIVRKHTPHVAQMNEKWWAEYCRFGRRDQMSFPIAFPKEEINLLENSVWRHPYFKFNMHK